MQTSCRSAKCIARGTSNEVWRNIETQGGACTTAMRDADARAPNERESGKERTEFPHLSLAVAEGEEAGAQDRQEAVEDTVRDVNANVASALAELDPERLVELVANRVLAVYFFRRGRHKVSQLVTR